MRAGERTRLEGRLRDLEAKAHPPVDVAALVEEVLMRHDLIPRPPERVRCPSCGQPSDSVEHNSMDHPIAWWCTRCGIELAPDD